MKKYLALFSVFVAAIFSHAALAQAPVEVWVPGYNSNGTKSFYSTSNLTVAQAQRSAPIWELLPNGAAGAKVTMTSELAFGATKVPVIAKAVATGSAVFGTFKAIMGGPIGIGVTALMAAPAIIDWLNQGGVRSAPAGSSDRFEIKDNSVCTVAPCAEYHANYPYGDINPPSAFYPSPSQACSAAASAMTAADSGGIRPRTVVGASESSCSVTYSYPSCYGGTCFFSVSTSERSIPPRVPVWQPATADQIRVNMEKVPAGPAVINALLDAAGSLPIAYAPGGTTGPASVSGVPVVKTTPISAPAASSSTITVSGNPYGLTDGAPTVTASSSAGRDITVDGKTVSIPTTSTTTSTYNAASNSTTSTTSTAADPHTLKTSTNTKTDLTYGDGTVTGNTNTTTTSTLINNVTNNVVNTTTSSENKPSEQPKDGDLSFSDSALPALPVLYERKYPNGLTGIWTEKSASIKAAPLFTLVSGLMPSVGSTGACPSWPLRLDFATWSAFGVRDVAPPCWVWDFGKVIIVISSLLLARALIFGG